MARNMQLDSGDVIVPVGPWKDGIVNNVPGKSIPGSGLLDALNVDIDDSGAVRTRKGCERVYDLTDARCGYSFNDRIFFVEGTELRQTGDFVMDTLVMDGLTGSECLGYCEGQGILWVSSSLGIRRIDSNLDVYPGCPPTPSSDVSGSAISGGSLDAGRYMVALSFIGADGMEGGTRPPVVFDVAQGGRISLNLPSSSDPYVTHVRVYVGTANGTVLYKFADMPNGVSSLVVSSGVGKGMTLRTGLMFPMPSVDMIQFCRGRLIGASGNLVWIGEPYRGALVSGDGWIRYERDVELIAAVEDGFYVCAGETFFVSFDSNGEVAQRGVLPYGAASGTLTFDDETGDAYWWSTHGMVVAGDGGEIRNMTSQRLAPEKYVEGVSVFRRQDGIANITSVFKDSGGNNAFACSDFAEAEVVRASLR